MGFKGSFSLITTKRFGIRMYSFTLKCTNIFQSETFDCALIDCYNQHPWFFRNQRLKAGAEMHFNGDTISGFDSNFGSWCQGDKFAIIDKNNKIIKQWTLTLREYAQGECPECHGSKQCAHCRGEGIYTDRSFNIIKCPYCGGTGTCQTCDIPYRKAKLGGPIMPGGPTGQMNGPLI